MKRLALILAVLAAPGLAGCMSGGGGGSAGSDVSTDRFKRSSDTLGTQQRRMDVYGGATSPVLPTMGAIGYGK
ncbi:hypothetical protein [Enterovirga sp.]|uniref:hypothetical protein n=1 Tax=Enterovirga sp. TaxID=2026350 RepID=UPI002BC19802|nr:hypothetical protein [Enterovirga sp.]HMO30602.1 hypothetical protein [Enterovirga sp.]